MAFYLTVRLRVEGGVQTALDLRMIADYISADDFIEEEVRQLGGGDSLGGRQITSYLGESIHYY